MEKMLYLIHAGRLVFAFALVVSAWREYNHEGTWRVFSLNGEIAAEEYNAGLGIVMKAKYIIGLGIVMKLFGGIFFIFSTYLGALLLLIHQAILSPILYDLYNRDFTPFQESYQHFVQKVQSDCEQFGVNNVKHRKLCDRLSKYVNGTASTDDRVAMCYYNSIAEEDLTQKFCDRINEIKRLASSNPLFTQSKFNTIFMPFIKRVGVVSVLVFFIAMQHKYRMLKKHKSN